MFELSGNEILSVSPQGVEREEYRYQNIYLSGYFILRDGKVFKEDFRGMGYGALIFYAPQTFVDKKGRRILIGWMGMPDAEEEYVNNTLEEGWQHCLTVPRELKYCNGKSISVSCRRADESSALEKKSFVTQTEKQRQTARLIWNFRFRKALRK